MPEEVVDMLEGMLEEVVDMIEGMLEPTTQSRRNLELAGSTDFGRGIGDAN